MFLGMLNGYQRDAFVALAQRIVMADGTMHPAEAVLLKIGLAEMGESITAPPSELVDLPNLGVFDTYASRVIVMLELFVLAGC